MIYILLLQLVLVEFVSGRPSNGLVKFGNGAYNGIDGALRMTVDEDNGLLNDNDIIGLNEDDLENSDVCTCTGNQNNLEFSNSCGNGISRLISTNELVNLPTNEYGSVIPPRGI